MPVCCLQVCRCLSVAVVLLGTQAALAEEAPPGTPGAGNEAAQQTSASIEAYAIALQGIARDCQAADLAARISAATQITALQTEVAALRAENKRLRDALPAGAAAPTGAH